MDGCDGWAVRPTKLIPSSWCDCKLAKFFCRSLVWSLAKDFSRALELNCGCISIDLAWTLLWHVRPVGICSFVAPPEVCKLWKFAAYKCWQNRAAPSPWRCYNLTSFSAQRRSRVHLIVFLSCGLADRQTDRQSHQPTSQHLKRKGTNECIPLQITSLPPFRSPRPCLGKFVSSWLLMVLLLLELALARD